MGCHHTGQRVSASGSCIATADLAPLTPPEPAAMDTTDVAAARTAGAGQPPAVDAAGKQPPAKRGSRTSKQKQRKRKSLEKALAVSSRVETKAVRTGARNESRKRLKKLWQGEGP